MMLLWCWRLLVWLFAIYNIYICWCINKCKCILYINSINMITCCGGGRGVLIRWPVMNINGNWRCANVTRCVRAAPLFEIFVYILSHAYAETCLFSKLVYNYVRVSISSPKTNHPNRAKNGMCRWPALN